MTPEKPVEGMTMAELLTNQIDQKSGDGQRAEALSVDASSSDTA
ncbi:hypothetical protein F4560_008470 [Saccharothrix ecbatanensis]|uniref:Uncharacterized protein n=1 Tax=Saccharothrix ecbatanensis TaxID=1105145 RepID=A0A7W9HUF7_9PSEU|nr:hypothetical protein [Saccharothrix ecbatanensis]MBB5808702.1 hypothetical protein [Saccharothrix ecbatanensis]